MPSPETCPVCGADVPPSARACPECGSDDTTGWNEDHAVYDGLDLPDNEFDYNAYLKKEFGGTTIFGGKSKRFWMRIGIAALAIALIVLVVCSM